MHGLTSLCWLMLWSVDTVRRFTAACSSSMGCKMMNSGQRCTDNLAMFVPDSSLPMEVDEIEE